MASLEKTLLVVGDPYWPSSVYNKIIVDDLQKAIPGLVVSNLYDLYPDYKIDVAKEREKLEAADNIIIQGPLYWYSLPSLTMRWIEEVFSHGWAYGSTGNALAGKNIVVGVTTGGPKEEYNESGALVTELSMDLRYKAGFEMCKMAYKGFVLNGGFINWGTGVADPVQVEVAHRHAEELIKRLK